MITQTKIHTYELYTYDLIMEDDSLSVNDRFSAGITIDIPEDLSDNDVIKLLIDKGILIDANVNDFSIDGESEYTLYINYQYNPCCELVNTNIGGDND